MEKYSHLFAKNNLYIGNKNIIANEDINGIINAEWAVKEEILKILAELDISLAKIFDEQSRQQLIAERWNNSKSVWTQASRKQTESRSDSQAPNRWQTKSTDDRNKITTEWGSSRERQADLWGSEKTDGNEIAKQAEKTGREKHEDINSPLVMSEEEFLAQNGASFDYGDPGLHYSHASISQKQWSKKVQAQAMKDAELTNRRAELRKLYKEKVANGEIRDWSDKESLIRSSLWQDEDSSVQASRRLLKKKHGIIYEEYSRQELINMLPKNVRENIERIYRLRSTGGSVGIAGAEKNGENKNPTGYATGFDGNEALLRPLTKQEEEFVKNFEKLQNGIWNEVIIAYWQINKWEYSNIKISNSTDEKIRNRHGKYNIWNLIINIHDADSILRWKKWKHTRINYIKYLDGENFLLTSVDEWQNGNYTVTHFPVIENPKEYINIIERDFEYIKKSPTWASSLTDASHLSGVGDYTNSIPENRENASGNLKSTGGNEGISQAEARGNGEQKDFKLSERIKEVMQKYGTNYTRYVDALSVGTFYVRSGNIGAISNLQK